MVKGGANSGSNWWAESVGVVCLLNFGEGKFKFCFSFLLFHFLSFIFILSHRSVLFLIEEER